MRIQIGAKYRDKITLFEGVCVGCVQYISGCNQALIQPQSKDGTTFAESHWFDEQRLERTGSHVVRLDNGETPGFDKAAPKR